MIGHLVTAVSVVAVNVPPRATLRLIPDFGSVMGQGFFEDIRNFATEALAVA